MVAAKEFALILGGAVASILASIHRAAEKATSKVVDRGYRPCNTGVP